MKYEIFQMSIKAVSVVYTSYFIVHTFPKIFRASNFFASFAFLSLQHLLQPLLYRMVYRTFQKKTLSHNGLYTNRLSQ